MTFDYKKIQKKLSKALDQDRYEHTLGVAKTAQMLACINNFDKEKAYLAGLLHDCAKNIPNKEKIKLCKEANIKISEVEKENPSLLHAKVGSIIAKSTYNIDDIDVLNAISSHTTGRPNMSILEKIVFVADYIEPGRPDRENLNTIRKLAMNDLDSAIVEILSDTLNYLANSAKAIDPMTKMTYDFYNIQGDK